jgi:hypothetical protein
MDTLRTLFHQIPSQEASYGLKGRILAAIATELEKRVKLERRAAYTGMLFSVAIASIASFGYGSEFIQSDFWSLTSLVLSDTSVLTGYWSSVAYSLLETFPVGAAIAFVLPVFLFLISLGTYSRFQQDANRYSRYRIGNGTSVTA